MSHYQCPYLIPKAHLEAFHREVDRLVGLGVLVKASSNQWGSPCLPVRKPDGSIRFITDLRAVNERVKRDLYPLPRVEDIFHQLEGYTFATAFDYVQGYYHIKLSKRARDICTITLPWGKFSYAHLPMGLVCAPDYF